MLTLLLLDVAMPGMGGVEFLETFLKLPQAQQAATVIVVLTTSIDSCNPMSQQPARKRFLISG